MEWLAVAVLAVVGVAAWQLAEGILHVLPERRFEPEPGHPEVAVNSADGLTLRAWYFPPGQCGRVIYILHGFTDCRGGMWDHIQLFRELGFGVLAPDSRGHGTSGGDLVTFGDREAGDVLVWLAWLRQAGAREVAAFGQSMGAAVALLSLARGAPWSHVVAEAGFTRFSRVAADKIAARARIPGAGWLMWPVAQAGMIYARLRYGVNLWRSNPVDAVGKARTPVLLIHGARDASIRARHSRALHAAAHGSQYWEIPEAAHTDAVLVARDEYRRRLAEFLNAPPGANRA
ncbi:MAG: alpha/beta fold hydrolase [Bryobacterales bacterium]|nr:alpha/beta fold hydrolase [Bryobacterales bacterium]